MPPPPPGAAVKNLFAQRGERGDRETEREGKRDCVRVGEKERKRGEDCLTGC